MSNTSQQLLCQALDLPVAERGQLAAKLIESLDSQVDADAADAWAVEIHRRLDSIDAGEVRMIPLAEARAMIRGLDGTSVD